MEDSYRLVIAANIDGNEEEMFEFDNVSDEVVSTNSTVSQHPILSGDSIGDHMYREPTTVNVSGIFSLNGRKGKAYYGSYDRLKNIQDTFEQIKNKGIRCTLVKLNRSDDKSTRFKERSGMVLNSITWTQKQNSMDFTFGFVEVITAKYDESDVIVDPTDPSLPAITDPATLSLSQANLIDRRAIMTSTVQILFDLGLITADFLQAAGSAVVAGLATGLAIGIGTLSLVAGICGGIASMVPVGTIIVAAVAIAAVVVGAIVSLVNFFQKKSYKIQAFTDYNVGLLTKDMSRFYSFMDDIYKEVGELEQYCKCFTFIDSIDQECLLYIDNEYYIFKLVKDIEGYYILTVTDVNGTDIHSDRLIGLQSLSDCNDTNFLFQTSNNQLSVYILNNKLYNLSKNNASEEEIVEASKDLRNYVVFVTSMRMSEYNDTIVEIIKNKIGA